MRRMVGFYKKPVPKMADTGNFLLIGICKCHIAHNGRANVAVSDKRFMTPHENVAAIELIHFPFTSGFQMASLGVHWKMNENIVAR